MGLPHAGMRRNAASREWAKFGWPKGPDRAGPKKIQRRSNFFGDQRYLPAKWAARSVQSHGAGDPTVTIFRALASFVLASALCIGCTSPDDAVVSSPELSEEPRGSWLLAVGDSITYGWEP